MGHVGQQGPQRADHFGVQYFGGMGNVVHEGPPPQLGFVADDADQVVVGIGHPGHVDRCGRPDDPTSVVLVEVDAGACHGEVEEVLGVDGGHVDGLVVVPDVTGGRGAGFAGIVPALEGG